MTLNDNQLFHFIHQNYLVTDQDTSGPNYTGFLKNDGSWYIMKQTISGTDITYLYAKGASAYATNWTLRATLTYAIPSTTFA